MLIQFVMVGLGGALGSMLRYLISLIPVNNTFPFLTLITNLLGALLIGFIVGLSDNLFISKKFLLFLKTGVCGGFTTFSTFSLEAVQLFQRGEPFGNDLRNTQCHPVSLGYHSRRISWEARCLNNKIIS